MCDRILIMNEGAILGEYSSAEFEREKFLRTMKSHQSCSRGGNMKKRARGHEISSRLLSLWLFIAVFGVLGCLSGKFLEPQNLLNILVQSSALAGPATGP